MKFDNLRTLANYARLSDVTYRGARSRVESGAIDAVEIDGVLFIDIERFPPKPSKTIKRRNHENDR